MGRLEGSADAPSDEKAAPTNVPQTSDLSDRHIQSPAVLGPDLQALSQQMQLQQQQIQNQLEELKQIKRQDVAPLASPAPSAPLAEVAPQAPKAQADRNLDLREPLGSIRNVKRKHAKMPVALATERTLTKETASAVPSFTPTASPKAEVKVEDDGNHLQAPKDFPAALRGGWQALLAQKRAESKKKPVKADESSSIMELMQTPKTYTAWPGA